MPNWCTNVLTVNGGPNDISRFQDKAHDPDVGPLCLQKLYPMPEDPAVQLAEAKETDWWPMAENIHKGNKSQELLLRDAWWDWRVGRWGTKWDLDDETQLTAHPGSLMYEFHSAWSPPVGVIEKAAEEFPELEFTLEYYEPGCDFAGVLTINRHGQDHEQGHCADFSFSEWVTHQDEDE